LQPWSGYIWEVTVFDWALSSTDLNSIYTTCRLDGYFEFNDQCISQCPDTFYKSSENSCLQCNSACKDCYGQGISSCITCADGNFFEDGICVNSCPEGKGMYNGACTSSCPSNWSIYNFEC